MSRDTGTVDYKEELVKGIFKENPVFGLMLGLCPTLAVTTNLKNGVGMGVAAGIVLLGSNLVISLIRNVTPAKIRIPIFITVIAAFVTMVDLWMAALLPPLHAALGLFIPLIVVNCIILGRAEAFASKNGPLASLVDAVGMTLGFTLSLALLGGLREILGTGSLWGVPLRVVLGAVPGYEATIGALIDWVGIKPALLSVLSPGAFLIMGLLMGYFQHRSLRKAGESA